MSTDPPTTAASVPWSLDPDEPAGDRRFLVVLNLGHEPRAFPAPAAGHLLLSTYLDREGETCEAEAPIALRPDEGLIVALAS